MTKIELERALEDRCTAKIEARGGLCLKLRPPTGRGFPDRVVFLPRSGPRSPLQPGEWRDAGKGPVCFFVEFKRQKTGVIATQQNTWRRMLTLAGFGVYFCDDDAGFDAALERELNR